jgi:DNA-binding response OmpR family regulator
MPTRGPQQGRSHLARKSELAIARSGKPAFANILIVEDNVFEADRLNGTLNIVFNRKSDIRRAATLTSALDAVIANKPDVIFLDDKLPPNDNASQTIPFLRRCGYEGPIIVVSSLLTRQRRAMLMAAGAIEAIHKDDLDGMAIEEALARVYAEMEKATGPDVASDKSQTD